MQKDPRFYIEFSYEGHDVDYDRLIEAKINKEASTGYNFMTGRRDIVFYFYHENAAQNALKKLKRFKKYNAKSKLIKCDS